MVRWRRRATVNHIGDPRELEHTQRERDEANVRMVAAIQLAVQAWHAAALADQRAQAALGLMLSMVEPGEVDDCRKVRLRSRDEAKAFAARVLAETGVRCVPRKCQYCPRQPVGLEKFWHITTADPDQRGKRRGPHHHQARLLRHVSPDTADMLRARLQQEMS